MSSSRLAPALQNVHSTSPPQKNPYDNNGLIQRKSKLERLLTWARKPLETNQNPICILSGSAGVGKSTLARQFAAHQKIQETFHQNIFWLDAGENPTDLSEQINEIGLDRSHTWTYKPEVRDAIEQLYQLFDDERFLLIVEDVGTVELTLQFLPPENTKRILVISRNTRLGSAIKAFEVVLREFSTKEAKRVATLLDIEEAKISARPTTRIPLIAYLIHLCRSRNNPLPVIPKDMSFESVLALLWSQLLSHYSQEYLVAIYTLGIFPPFTPLSYPVISRLWQEMIPGITQDELDELFDNLYQLRIVTHREHSNTAVTSDLFQQFVENHTEVYLPKLHAVLLRIYSPTPILNGESPNYDEYIYRFLPYHLSKANQTDTLFKLLLSVEWISGKIHKTDNRALQQDYRYGRSDKTIRLVDEAIRLSTHALEVDSAQVISQLISRLQQIDIRAVQGLVSSLRKYRSSESYWLDPERVDLKTPSSSLILSLNKHQDEVLSIDIDPKNQQAISSSRDLCINLWDLKENKVLKKLTILTEPAQQVLFLPNKLEALSASGSNITMWDLQRGKANQTYQFHSSNILSLYAFQDNQSILSADEAGQVLFTDLWQRIIKHRLEPDQELNWALAATRDQSTAFTAGNSESIQVWDLSTGKLRHKLTAHDDWIWALQTTKNDRFLLSASEDHTIIIWDLDASKVFKVLKGHKAGVRFISLAADDTLVLSADEEQSIILWDFQSGKMLRSFTGLSDWMNDFKALPDGKAAFLASAEPEVKLWSMSGKQRREEHSSHDKGIRALRLAPGDIQLISASDDATIRKWHVNTASLLDSFTGHSDWISSLSMSRTGSTVVSASFDKTLRIWDVETGRCKRALKGHSDWVWCAALSPNNKFIASGSEDCSVIIWNMNNGRQLHTLKTHTAAVTNVLISGDNKHIISASMDHTMGVWKSHDGSLQHILKGHTDKIQSVSLSPMGDRVVSGSADGSIRIWNFVLGKEDECLSNPGGAVQTVHVLKNGFRLLSVSEDYVLRVWDLVQSKPIYTLKGHRGDISHLAVSRDARWAATAGSDCKLCLWDLENGHLIDSFYADYPMTYCIFSTDGERLIGADAGGGLHFLRIKQSQFG